MNEFLKGVLRGVGVIVGTTVASALGVPELGDIVKTLISGGGGS